MMTDTHMHTYTHPYTHPCLPLTLRAHRHSHISGRFFYSTPNSASWHTHTHTSSCVEEICLMMTHTYAHPYSYPRLTALHTTYFFFMFTGAFLLHACGVTRNWRTYFISVWRVFLVETVVLQTVLWDNRAWSVEIRAFYNGCLMEFFQLPI